ncbi:InlB B-repeat-containing protein [Allobaculum sp. JKK-2023]|uniref:InlB B-repeat-containing protein n=1 Tax=Allobaculum sp. JKK-2023 TaxID=3108943 RepID=UPI002B053E1E|nr:InlB B-repeat-containing protein [Allobaculum sp. JKK-2023]
MNLNSPAPKDKPILQPKPAVEEKTIPGSPSKIQKDGGLYKNLNVPVKTLSMVIIGGLIALVFLAVWGSQSEGFSVRYSSQGGSDVSEQTYKYLEPLSKPEQPTRQGYSFEGWAMDPACQIPVEFGLQVEQAMELYACWSPSK